MLNRLYIVIGVLAILALAAAFVVPAFIPWGQYRDRMAEIAGEVLGAPVSIEGEVKFSLLPQPKLQFAKVTAGPKDHPSLTVEKVEADFSLIDFIRDRYTVTRLQLDQPVAHIRVEADGTVDTGIALAQKVSASNISVANATITDGTVELEDSRSGSRYSATAVNGELRLDALRGPFAFQGSGKVDGAGYGVRVTTGALDAGGMATLSASVRPADEHFALSVEGTMTTGAAPAFSGTMTYRQPPAKPVDPATEDAGAGDLVMTSMVEANAAKVLFSDYVLIPDENRAATRLLGAADVTLGAKMAFNAVISGGLLALPPRDATTEQAVEPYELVRLLRELPLPLQPGLPGSIGVDIAELNLRAFSLRNVRLDADAHDGGWTVREMSGDLPGSSRVTLAGEVTTASGHPEFAGTLALKSARLDALAGLWRKPAAGNPLFDMPGAIEAQLNLVGETLSVSDGRLTLDGETRSFAAQVGIGTSRELHISADLGALDAERSAALFALLPDLGTDAAFGLSFPQGEFEVTADTLSIGGLGGKSISARGSWDGGVLVIDDASAGDLGGASFQVSLTAFGSLEKPELSGTGTVSVGAPDAPALKLFYDTVATPPGLRRLLEASLPAELAIRLAAPSGDGAQSLALSGKLGSAELEADAELQAGFLRALSDTLKVRLDLKSADPAAMTAQLGLGETPLVAAGGPMHLVGVIEGNVATSLETTALVEGAGDSLGFSGNIVVADADEWRGKGTVKARLSDPNGIAERLGVGGLALPPISGSGTVEFAGLKSIKLDDISGQSGDEAFAGDLAYSGAGEAPAISGSIAAGRLELGGLLRTLAGPAALLSAEGSTWPDGPLDLGATPRATTGRVHVTSPAVTLGARELATALSFDLDWDATATRLRDLKGTVGGGSVGLELALCCAGPLADKQASGRVSLTGVALDAVVPKAVAEALDGTLDVAGRFDGTGDSVASLMAAMTGEGTYSVDDLKIAHFDPQAVAKVVGGGGVLEMQPEQMTALLNDRLYQGAFTSPRMAGSFTIAGGMLRSPNTPIDGEGGQLFGSGQIALGNLGISGSYTMSASGVAAGPVDANSAKVTANISGTLAVPERRFDVSALVDAVMVKAYEEEVARLEKLRAEDEAREREAAAEKTRADMQAIRDADAAMTEAAAAAEAKRAAEAAAAEAEAKRVAAEAAAEQKRVAAEAAAAKAAAEAARKKKAEEDAARPMDLGLGN